MKRKSRRKKDSDIPQNPETAKKENSNKASTVDNNKDGSRQTSRSSSRSRRSLSSFFRRSRDRHSRARSESSDRSKSRGNSSADAEASDLSAFNPRTEPRDHLRRMTVREALAESRTRGRSPNRRAIYNLEKRIMSPEELKQGEHQDISLSTSLPDIPDIIPSNNELSKETSAEISNSNDKLLDKSGKKRGYSGGHTVAVDSFPKTQTARNKDTFQPLDKRKYMINKDNSLTHHLDKINPIKTDNKRDSVLAAEADTHSRDSSRGPSPYSAFASDNNQHRRESFAKFLELREKRPPRSSSNYSIGRQSVESLDNFNDHQSAFHSQSSLNDPSCVFSANGDKKLAQPSKNVSINSFSSNERKSLTTSPSSRFQPIKPKSELKADSKQESINVSGHQKGDKKNTESKRGKYVSPRRFSRKSNTSKKSTESTKAVQDNIKADKYKEQLESAPTKKYQRKFSNSSEKNRRKISTGSNNSKQELGIQGQNTFMTIQPDGPTIESHRERVESLSQLYNNEIQIPTAIPAVSKTFDDSRTNLSTESKVEQNSNDISTGLQDVADRIKGAMLSVAPGNDLRFPNSECSAIPLESITNDVPFKTRTQSDTDTNFTKSRTRSHSKSTSTSKKQSSNSEDDPFNIESVDDILMQDDVFETNIDEISLKSGNKTDTQENQECSNELKSANTTLMNTDSNTASQKHTEEKIEEHIPILEESKVKGKNKISRKESKKKKKSKSDDNVAVVQNTCSEKIDISDKKKKSSKKVNKGRKKSKSKSSRSMSDLRIEDEKTAQNTDKDNEIERKLENDKIVKLEDCPEKPSKGKIPKRKSFFSRSRRSVSRTPSIQQAIVKVGRAASLSNILDTPEMKRKPSLAKTDSVKRSHSVEDISTLKHNKIEQVGVNIPDSIFHRRSAKDAIWNIQTEIPKSKDKKQQPKLSISAIIALRAKVGRFKKAKQEKEKRERESKDEASNNTFNDPDEGKDNAPIENDQTVPIDNLDAHDREIASVVFENELNVSLNKQNDATLKSVVIEDELDNEIASIVHEKKIHFDTYIGDIHLSEEEMIKQRQRNTRLTSRRESKVRQRQKKVINCCKQVIAFLFSHIGLCSLVVAYCIAGGFIFKKIEGMNELEKKREMQAVREDYTNQIFSLAFQNKFTKRSAKEFKITLEKKLHEYSIKVNQETQAGWDGKDSTNEPEQWSFPSSLLYAITVMTTIGYGHVAPKTDLGRIVTIGYAVIGIPLTLLCLTNLGDLMAKGFRWLYGKVFCGLCCILFRPSRKRRIPDPEKGLPANEERMLVQEEEKSEELVRVPTSVCLLLMTTYILLGTAAFAVWEGWDPVTGTYFCFITLSTIGFGDVVPGMTSEKWDMNEKLVICAFYLIIGLSLIAMCFNLVQEDVKAKCKWLGTKLGIIDEPVTSV